MPATDGYTFRQRHRLRHDREFQAVYNAGVRKQRGPLIVSTLPNALQHHRLGLSVGTRVGGAVVRNRCKRLVREAFRLEQHVLPSATAGKYDIVVGVRAGRSPAPEPRGRLSPGPLPPLAALRVLLADLVTQADTEWRRRARRDEQAGTGGTGGGR